jgi:hypothetical protein
MSNTPRFLLPYLDAAQAQKHVTHNQALQQADALASAYILDRDLTAPPGSPAEGDTYIVAASPTGAWAGQAAKIAFYADAGWKFYSAFKGLQIYVVDEAVLLVWTGAAWAQIASPNTATQVFTANGTWTKPAWAKTVRVILFGGGGGGGSGRRGAAASARAGGTGAYGSTAVEKVFAASDLTATVAVTIGAAGTGGAAITVDSTNGNDGTAGGDTTFGAFLRKRGAVSGKGGTTANTSSTTSADDPTGNSPTPQSTLIASDVIGLVPTNSFDTGGGQGGAGGSISTGNAELAGQKGSYAAADPSQSPAAKGAAGTSGSNGTNSAITGMGGGGGGGGGANPAGAGGAGGAGGIGAGGGGGGASVNGSNSGAGGNGGAGKAFVISIG